MSQRFSDHLRAAAGPIWEACLTHPFVLAIGDGSLARERFEFWVRQDYRFLIEYCRLFALAAARAPDLPTLTRFAGLAQSTAVTEMGLHRRLAAELGISAADLEAEPMAPATQAYTDFLIRTAATGDFSELCAALLPCMWGFSEVGQGLARAERPAEPRLAAWIDSYSDPEFAALANWCRELVDAQGGVASAAGRAAMQAAFITSSRYELAFWEMAWARAGWPV